MFVTQEYPGFAMAEPLEVPEIQYPAFIKALTRVAA
jgi:hypothetical protein